MQYQKGMNLQLFAEDANSQQTQPPAPVDGAGAGQGLNHQQQAPMPQYPQSSLRGTNLDPGIPQRRLLSTPDQASAQNQQQADTGSDSQTDSDSSQQRVLDFAGRRVPVTPPMKEHLEGLHHDFMEYQKTLQQEKLARRRLEQENLRLRRMMTQGQGQPVPQQQQQPEPQLSPEERRRINQELLDKFYEDPLSVIEQIRKETREEVYSEVKSEIEPIKRERQLQQVSQQLARQYPDFEQMKPVMLHLYEQNPELLQRPEDLEGLYYRAKALAAPQINVNDPQSILALIQQNPELRNALRDHMVQEYLNEKSQQQANVPPSLGTYPGGQPAMAPPQDIRSIKDATKAFRQYRQTQGVG